MQVERGEFGPVLLAWTDSAAAAPASADVLRRLGPSQLSRYASLGETAAQRFLTGRQLLAALVAELTDEPADLELTTTCERCGAEHGRPRLAHAPVAVSISYAGSVVAVAAVGHAEATAVGVDIEREPREGGRGRLDELEPLFAPGPVPDLQGWTLLEAALKADGRGVAVPLADVQVGEVGTGRLHGSRAVRIPGRNENVDAAVVVGPAGFVLSAAVVPVAAVLHPV